MLVDVVSSGADAAAAEASSPRRPLYVALDVGQKNLSLCALRMPVFAGDDAPPPTPLLQHARAVLQRSVLERWEVVSLCDTNSGQSFVERCKSIAEFVKGRRVLFAEASVVIIEHQMHSTMRCLASALFASIHMYANTDAKLVSQHSNIKLQWGDLSEHTRCAHADLKKYNIRKRAAIECVDYILSTQQNNPTTDAVPAEDTARMQKILREARKKDDLADAMLHVLAYKFRDDNTQGKRRKRQRQ